MYVLLIRIAISNSVEMALVSSGCNYIQKLWRVDIEIYLVEETLHIFQSIWHERNHHRCCAETRITAFIICMESCNC